MHEDEIKSVLPKPKKELGKIVIPLEDVNHFVKKRGEQFRIKKAQEKQLPKLHLDYDSGSLSFNGKTCDLNPQPEKIRKFKRRLFG